MESHVKDCKIYVSVFFLICFIVSCNNKKAENLVENSKPLDNRPETVTGSAEKIDCYFSVQSSEGLRVRKTPDLAGETVGLLKNEQIVRATQKTEKVDSVDGISSHWYYINYRELRGWVFGGYLKEFIVPEIDVQELNSVLYTDFKTNYGKLVPADFSSDWAGFYIFALDKIDYKQKIEMLMNDLYVEIDNGTDKIISGLYKTYEGDFGVFIAKVTNDYSKILEKIIGTPRTTEDILKIMIMRKNEDRIYYGNEFGGSFAYFFNSKNLNWDPKEEYMKKLKEQRENAYNSQNGTYENLLNYFRTKSVLIVQNNENKKYPNLGKEYKSEYKSNRIFGPNIIFSNNELLGDSKIKIGMSIDDVYALLGKPERTLANCIEYYKVMYVKEINPPYDIFYADTTIGFIFDYNNTITEIAVLTEGGDEPKPDDDYWE
jgi:Bacterial SH3 domain.